MIDEPILVDSPDQLTAVIRLNIPRSEMMAVMGPAIAELMAAVARQGIAPTGPLFTHHFSMHPDRFDFEVGVPVSTLVAPAGRVQPGQLHAARTARTTYHGPYEGLSSAWGEFDAWLREQYLAPAEDLWESYVAGPESNPDPATWRTQLNRPLIVTCSLA